jgi:hypothetical protein
MIKYRLLTLAELVAGIALALSQNHCTAIEPLPRSNPVLAPGQT